MTDDGPAVTLRGSGDFAACSSLVRRVVASRAREDGTSLRAPRVVAEGAFVGVSLTYHLTGFLARAFPGELASFPTPTMREVGRLATRACATPWERARVDFDGVDPNTSADRLPGRCFDAALVDALLGDAEDASGGDEGGFGFSRDDARVTFVEKLDGNEVEWTAGAAMTLAAPEPGCAGGTQTQIEDSRHRRAGRRGRRARGSDGGGDGGGQGVANGETRKLEESFRRGTSGRHANQTRAELLGRALTPTRSQGAGRSRRASTR